MSRQVHAPVFVPTFGLFIVAVTEFFEGRYAGVANYRFQTEAAALAFYASVTPC